MSRQSQQEVALAARRRLELLGRELDQAGLRRVDDEGDPWETRAPWMAEEAEPSPGAPAVGRHARTPERSRPFVAWAGGLIPDSLRGRVGLAPPSVVVVVVLVALAAVVTGVAVLRMGGDSQPVGPSGSASPLVPVVSAAPASRSPSARPGTAPGTVTVDVAGKVRRPGVATLPSGARVIDALRRAGGAVGGVDLSSLNLARVLVDGEQILVGGRPRATGRIAAGAAAAAPPPSGALVNLNTATAEQLDGLPGVGPVTAQKILAWRAAHGAFTSVDELLEVDGIGEKTLAEIAPRATL